MESKILEQHQLFPVECKHLQQFTTWQKSRPWLSVTAERIVKCRVCAEVGSLGVHTQTGQHGEGDNAFATASVKRAKKAKCLLKKKINKHIDSQYHMSCESIRKQKQKNALDASVKCLYSLFEEREKDAIEATEKIFRTAYEYAHSQLSFAEHKRLVILQEQNGLHVPALLNILLNKCVMR